MKWIALLAVLLSPAFVAAQATEPAAFVKKLAAGKPQVIVCYGTSLTQGGAWVNALQKALNQSFPKKATVLNRGGPGQNSTWGVASVQKVIDAKPDVVFIEFSVNDAVERFHLPVEQAKKNLETIVDAIHKANPDTQIILQIMNPIVGHPEGDNSHRKDLPAYWEMYRAYGKEHGYLVIDHSPAWQAVLDKGEDEYKKLVPDGVHPNAEGNEKIIVPTMLKELGLEKPKK